VENIKRFTKVPPNMPPSGRCCPCARSQKQVSTSKRIGGRCPAPTGQTEKRMQDKERESTGGSKWLEVSMRTGAHRARVFAAKFVCGVFIHGGGLRSSDVTRFRGKRATRHDPRATPARRRAGGDQGVTHGLLPGGLGLVFSHRCPLMLIGAHYSFRVGIYGV
jgi:hypothetical protein